MAEKKNGRIESKDLLVVEKKDPEAGQKFNKSGHVIRCVQWLYEKKDGSVGGSVSLEKREIYITEDGEERNGKAKGFTLLDLESIKAVWPKIVEAMRNAPEPEWVTGRAAAKKAGNEVSDDLEEVPF